MRISDWSSDVCSSDLFMVASPFLTRCRGRVTTYRRARPRSEHPGLPLRRLPLDPRLGAEGDEGSEPDPVAQSRPLLVAHPLPRQQPRVVEVEHHGRVVAAMPLLPNRLQGKDAAGEVFGRTREQAQAAEDAAPGQRDLLDYLGPGRAGVAA